MKRFLIKLRKFNKNLLFLLSVLGPGIITSAADNDAGGIITYLTVGALYRFDMVWILVALTIALIVTQEMCARMGAVTQKGLGELIRENFGVKWSLFALTILLIANLATTVAEFAGIAASLSLFGISKFITIPICALIIWFIVVKGNFKIVEKIFMFFAVLYISYLLSVILAKPDWKEVAYFCLPNSMSIAKNKDFGYFIFLSIAIIGTTITPWMQFFLQANIVDKGIKIKDYKYQIADVIIGSISTNIISVSVVVCAGICLFGLNSEIDFGNISVFANSLRPVAGNFAPILFGAGLFAASFLAAAVLPLSTAYSYSEAFGFEIGISRKFREAPVFYTIFTFTLLFGATVVLLSDKFVEIMINAQAVSGFLLPVILIFMLKLINNPEIMGKYVNNLFYNIIAWVVSSILIIMTVLYII
ncbi:MAG: divalent metal cation transporter, partial [Armatimonadetes bacterium]|nr:divalent metal cation transporter [Candidatus Hippobium faecium]